MRRSWTQPVSFCGDLSVLVCRANAKQCARSGSACRHHHVSPRLCERRLFSAPAAEVFLSDVVGRHVVRTHSFPDGCSRCSEILICKQLITGTFKTTFDSLWEWKCFTTNEIYWISRMNVFLQQRFIYKWSLNCTDCCCHWDMMSQMSRM